MKAIIMKVVRKNDSELVLEDFPYGLTGMLMLLAAGFLYAFMTEIVLAPYYTTATLVGIVIGFLLTGFGAYLFGQRSIFRFDKEMRLLYWRRLTFLRRNGGTVPFEDIERALVRSESLGEVTPNYRVVLETRTGDLPLTRYFGGSWNTNDALAEEINKFLNKRWQTIVYQ